MCLSSHSLENKIILLLIALWRINISLGMIVLGILKLFMDVVSALIYMFMTKNALKTLVYLKELQKNLVMNL